MDIIRSEKVTPKLCFPYKYRTNLALLRDKNLREKCKEVNLDETLNKREMRNLDTE